MQNYGITLHGKHAIINLRVDLEREERVELWNNFEDLVITISAKGYTLIKGCIPSSKHQEFWHTLQMAKIKSKITRTQRELEKYPEKHMGYISEDEIELPF